MVLVKCIYYVFPYICYSHLCIVLKLIILCCSISTFSFLCKLVSVFNALCASNPLIIEGLYWFLNSTKTLQAKWQPLHTLAASGEFYLLTSLLKHVVDINVPDKVQNEWHVPYNGPFRSAIFVVFINIFVIIPNNSIAMKAASSFSSSYWVVFSFLLQDGLTAIHKAILGKKQAIFNFLLRESANPLICDKVSTSLYKCLTIYIHYWFFFIKIHATIILVSI